MKKRKSKEKQIKKPTAVSMFAGCGGMDVGFIQAGFDVVWANDINQDACKTYRENIGDIICDDIDNLIPPKVAGLDVLMGGFPCQPYSNAGNRKGLKDHRGNLYQYCLDFARQLSPKFILLENVRGFLSIKGTRKKLVEEICDSLIHLGYEVHLNLVNAADFGVPQNRLRVIIVGVKKSATVGTYRFPKTMSGLDLSIGKAIRGIKPNCPNQNDLLRLNPQAIQIGSMVPEGGSWKSIPYEKLPPRLQYIRNNMRKYRWPNFYRRFHRTEIAGTITAAFKPENAGVWHPLKGRVLSAREIARIQTFPDSFRFYGRSVKSIYEMIGNAVPPGLARVFAESIKLSLAGVDALAEVRNYFEVMESGVPIRPDETEMIYMRKQVRKENKIEKENELLLTTVA